MEKTADGRTVIRGAESGPMKGPFSIDVDLRDMPEPPAWEPGDPIKEIPRRSYPPPGFVEPRVPATPPDRLLARQPIPPEPYTMDFDVPIFNIDAQNFTGVSPPDTNGDVGPDHYIQAVNTPNGSSITIYDKATTPPSVITTFILDGLPGVPAPCNDGLGDPVVLYDPLADRWLLAEFAQVASRTLCVYISRTSDPVGGGWWMYTFQTPNFPDYPKYAVWPDAYYVTSNEDSPPAYALDRTNMLAGLTPRPFQRFTATSDLVFPFQALTPADLDGAALPPAGAPGIIMRHRDDEVTPPPATNDFLDMWEFHVDFNTPANSTFTQLPSIAISDFSSELCGISSHSCFPQPSGPMLDPLREVIMFRLQYRNFGTHQALTGNFVTDADGEGGGDPIERGGIRWFELRKTGSTWSLFQEGTYSPNDTRRWMGGISMDGNGNMAVGYNVSSTSIFPGLRYAGRLASDPPGTLGAEVSLVAGSASSSTNRYGDYSDMAVDPVDDCTFWFTGEYNPLAQWRTRIAAFRFDSCVPAIPANNAVFDAVLQAPSCNATGRSCVSAATLVGRDTITGGPEPNQPNTIGDSCADGTMGRFHVRESIDRIKVLTLDGTQLSPGKTVRVDVTVWGFSRGFQDTLDLYSAANANSPTWIPIGSVKSGKVGLHVISMTYTLPAGTLQAVRARYRYRGDPMPCGAGDFTDHDDLAFVVQ